MLGSEFYLELFFSFPDIRMDGSSTTGMLSSLATYADSDEEIGNTPTNQATEGVAEVIINNVDDRNSIELDGKNIEEMSENASVMGKPEGGSQGGEYNMLPSEFNSDYDRDFSGQCPCFFWKKIIR